MKVKNIKILFEIEDIWDALSDVSIELKNGQTYNVERKKRFSTSKRANNHRQKINAGGY